MTLNLRFIHIHLTWLQTPIVGSLYPKSAMIARLATFVSLTVTSFGIQSYLPVACNTSGLSCILDGLWRCSQWLSSVQSFRVYLLLLSLVAVAESSPDVRILSCRISEFPSSEGLVACSPNLPVSECPSRCPFFVFIAVPRKVERCLSLVSLDHVP